MKKQENKELAEEQEESEEKQKEEQDESGLEEEIEETEDIIKDQEFHEFLKPSAESFSPVLERAESPRQISDLEQDIAGVLTSTEDRDDDARRYTPVTYAESYRTESERNIEGPVEESNKIREILSVSQPAPTNIEAAGRDLRPQLRDVSLINLESQELREPRGTLEEKYVQPERIDMEKVGREKTPSRKVQKYEIR